MSSSANSPSNFIPDPASVEGKQPPIDATTDLLIVGAGPAGMSAALTAAGQGARVTLVDENPIPLQTMGQEVPLHFGGRMAATLSNQKDILERILEANPQLAEALDAGVDVRLGTAVWGLFPQHSTAAWIDGPVAGLADAHSVYLMRFKQVVVATGRRDMGLAFAGWERPGVMGASAAYRLASTYNALESKVAVLVGSDTEALQVAKALAETGVHIEAIIEQSAQITGSSDLLASLTSRGTRIFTRHVVQEAHGDNQGVTSLTIVAIDDAGRQQPERRETLNCDTVLLGVGAIPTIELIESCGCSVSFQVERGGHVPVIDHSQRTSLSCIYVAGDCAGIWPSKTLSDSIARQEGRLAARAALRALGLARFSEPGAAAPAASAALAVPAALAAPAAPAVPAALAASAAPEDPPVTPDTAVRDVSGSRMAWVRASVLGSSTHPHVCQCEEVTAQEILTLQPPRYLDWTPQTLCQGQREPASLRCAGDTPLNPDSVKRLTRAGMGPCQGRRCREQIAALIALDSNTTLAEVPLATYRTPVRPLTLAQMALLAEAPATAPHWDSWFGMPTQWVPFWRVPAAYTVATRNPNEPAGGE
jgi:thioredoxin reductase